MSVKSFMFKAFRFSGMGAAVLGLFLLGAFIFFNLPGPEPREDIRLGMTFSYTYAQELGLDWQETYRALLDDLGIRLMRVPVYWDQTEAVEGKYDFSTVDWQIDELGKRQGRAILAIGQRVPRWPECHIPEWIGDDAALRKDRLLRFLRLTVERYREDKTITTWQVENEPFLTFFGRCPPLDPQFLALEVALVKELDPSRPVLLTDSGELSWWLPAARQGDIFGTTLYRQLKSRFFGYITYPVGPNFFLAKELLVRLFTHQQHFIVIELQGEPWASRSLPTVPLPEQFRTMDERKLLANVTYARRLGFPEVYLWGGEWWYWLKVKKDYPALWETARGLYEKYGGTGREPLQ